MGWALLVFIILFLGSFAGMIASAKKSIERKKIIKQRDKTILDYENAFEKLSEIEEKKNEQKESYRTGNDESDFNQSMDVLRNLSRKSRKSDKDTTS